MTKNLSLLPDLILTLPVILLLSLSILVIYSSDPNLAIQQFIFAILGLISFLFLSLVNFEHLSRGVWISYALIIVLLVITFIVGYETRGSYRWIPLGEIQFQPSEFAKPVLILVLAHFWRQRVGSWINIGKSLLLVLPILVLVFQQPDLGTTLTLISIWGAMLIGANISTLKIFIMTLTTAPLVYLASFLLKDYQKERILSFLTPTHDPLGIGYNVIQSTIAVGSGQIFGRGLGRGTQSRLQFLPEFRTDFVFASIAEEFGFLGSMIVLGLYGILFGRCLSLVATIASRFGGLVIVGTVGMLFFQTVVNIGMNIGLLPITGITLPLLSYGGSSLLSTLICLSLVASITRYSPLRHQIEVVS